MIYIATNCDKKFYENKPKNIIESLLKFKNENTEIMFFQIDFYEEIESVKCIKVPIDEVKESKRYDIENRPWFVCLESGEFIKFFNFKDDDILILLDYDIIQQREINHNEMSMLNGLIDGKFLVTRNEYTEDRDSDFEMDIVCMDKSIMKNEETFKIYNTGCQIGRISTWKKMYNEYKKIHKQWEEKCKHHATGQLIFNYIGAKNNMIVELHPSFHSSWGFHGLKHFTRDKKFYLVENETLVLFNHHVWHKDFV